jgi:hypothetical protein
MQEHGHARETPPADGLLQPAGVVAGNVEPPPKDLAGLHDGEGSYDG